MVRATIDGFNAVLGQQLKQNSAWLAATVDDNKNNNNNSNNSNYK